MFKRKSVNVAALIALGVAAPVFAQQAAPAQQLERVEVTGSRIKTLNTETASPVISLGAEAIKVEGKRDVESLLNNLPQVFADQGGQVSNGSTGTATVNLRNLGADRTLVLINGRRMPAGSPRSLPTDLNQIPVSLIKRVEVLTGGASAVYGSDAVAGVVNFVMNDKFEGVEVEANYSFFNHNQQNNKIQALVASRAATNPSQYKVPGDISADGKVMDFSLTMGSNFADNKGNATLFVSRKTTDALLQSQRDFTSCALNYNRNNAANAFGGFTCGGSGTSFPGQFSDFSNYALTVADANGTPRNYSGATDAYNFGPLNYFQRPSTRYTAAAFAHYDISDAARVYAELNFHDDSTVAQIAPSGSFFNQVTVSYENPLLSQGFKDAFHAANVADGNGTFNKAGDTHTLFIGRRNVEGGGRQDDIRHTSYRGVVGVKGEINPALSYDAYALVGRVVYQETYKNDFSIARTARALDVVRDPTTGNAVCRSVLDGTDPNCVPWNIWKLGGVTPQALGYVQTPGFQKGFTATAVTGATVSGDLTDYGIKSPMASSGLGFAVGLERRVEKMELSTDAAFTTGDLAGQGGPTIGVGGQYAVNDVFTELRMPLIEKMPFVEQLSLTASYRKSNYSTNKKTDTYGLGLEYAPIKEVKFRGSFQQASRAANVIELFSAQGLGLYDNDADPCAGAAPTRSLADCARTGVTAGQYGRIPDSPAGQYNQISGGNPNLTPETSKSTTFGVILQPMRNTSVSLDYFNIKVKDTIGTRGAVNILNECLNTGASSSCSLIKRDAVGSLWLTPNAYIVNTNFNIGQVETEGVDIAADSTFKLGEWGSLNTSIVGTYLNKYVEGAGGDDCAGKFGDGNCGTPLPKWRHKLRFSWNTPWGVNLAATLRHIDSVKHDNPASTAQVASLAARDYLDLAASYKLTKNVTIRAAVNNLLDKDPPIRTNGAGFTNGNTYPQVYEANGRQISLNVTAKF